MFKPSAAAFLFLAASALASASAIRYDITDLNPGPVATALAINSAGHIVGYYQPTGSISGGTHGFLYKDGVVTDIPTFGGLECQATGINDSDVVIGWADYSTAGFTQAFTLINGTMKNLGTLGGSASYGLGINNSGIVTGYSRIAGNSAVHAFVYSTANAGISNTDDVGTLGGANSYSFAINSIGVAVGGSYVTGDLEQHATSYYLGGRFDLGTLGGPYSYAYAITDSAIVGAAYTSDNVLRAFSYGADGHLTNLGALNATDSSQAKGVNASGQIVGFSQRLNGLRHAFLYTGGVMHDLNAMIAPGTDKIISEANAINDSGQIVGTAYNTALTAAYAVLLTPRTIPAPTLTIAGKARIKTKKAKLTISGSASGEVSSVTWQISGKSIQTATGTTAWSLRTAKLKHGRTVISVTAHGYGGDSPARQVTIIRR